MASTLIPRSSSKVFINPVPAEKTFGLALRTGIGAGPSAFINYVMSEIPKQIEGVDQQADSFLEQLIALLDQLAVSWKDKTEPDTALLNHVIVQLTLLSQNPDPAGLLYPQIVRAKPASTSDYVQQEEQKEIEAKKSIAIQKARELLFNSVSPLLLELVNFQTPSMSDQRNAAGTLERLGKLTKELKEIAQEQRSLLAKVIHTITTIVTETLRDQWTAIKSTKGEAFTVNQHPLMELLAMMGGFQRQKVYLESDKRRALETALRKLDTQCPNFKGVYEFVASKNNGQLPYRDLQAFHQQITQFLRATVLPKLNKNETYLQVANFALRRKAELIEMAKLEAAQQKERAFQDQNQKLGKAYIDIGQDSVVGRLTNALGATTSAAEKRDRAYKESVNALADEEERINEALDNKIQEIESNQLWSSIEQSKVKFGKSLCEGTSQNVPNDYFDEIVLNEILWKAIAFQEQKAVWETLKDGLAKKENKDPKTIIRSLDEALEYLERYASIEEGIEESEKVKSVELARDYILDWMDFAKIQMVQFEQNTWEKAKIDAAFREGVERLRKGEVILGVKYIQNFIRESNYWKNLWSVSPSPLGLLSNPFTEFCEVTPPPKPPKCAGAVKEVLGKASDTPWNDNMLSEANQLEKGYVLDNALALACFEFVAHLIALNEDKTASYRRLMTALDELKKLKVTEDQDQALTQILGRFFNRGIEAVKDKKTIDAMKRSLRLLPNDVKERHKQLYFLLINLLVGEKSSGYSPAAWVAWSFYPLVYDLVELFIRPFTESVLGEVNQLLQNTSGTLDTKHLVPVVGVTKALSTYMRAMESWEKQLEAQDSRRASPGKVLSGTKDDLRILLDRADRYEGMTPEQITLRMGYALVRQIKLPDYSSVIAASIEGVKKFAWTARVGNKFLNIPIVGVQMVIASPVYLGFNVMYFVVKIITACINVAVQQTANLYLWKTNKIGQIMDQALESVFIDAESAPILDTLLLEQLEDLLKELEKGTPPENPKTAAGDDRNKQVISEALQHLFEAIELDKYDSLNTFKSRPQSGAIFDAKKLGYEQLKKLLSTVLVNTSKSLLQKEQIDALLFELFRIANEGLRGGKTVVLTQQQRADFGKKVSNPTDDQIQQEAQRIARENIEKIPKVLAQIRKQAVNPAIDKQIDSSLQTNSQLLLDYIGWLQSRLLSQVETGQGRNIIHFIKGKLEVFSSSNTGKDEILRDIHFAYAKFLQELIEFQTQLDGKPSPNSPELNQLILSDLASPIKELTDVLKAFIQNPGQKLAECKEKLRALEEVQARLSVMLSRIEEAEKTRVLGMHAGIEGIVRSRIAESFHPLKDAAKQTAHTIVQWETDNKVDELRGVYKNKTLVKHALLWQMRLYLNPELAFRA